MLSVSVPVAARGRAGQHRRVRDHKASVPPPAFRSAVVLVKTLNVSTPEPPLSVWKLENANVDPPET